MRATAILWILAGLLLLAGGGAVYTMTRGLRNNNPGNIREGQGDRTWWQGERPTDDDAAFEEFETPEYGIRAMAVILKNYLRQGRATIEQIISRWAPANENDTEAYINAVSRATGIPRTQPVSEADFPVLIAAMIKHENGIQPYSFATIEKGVSLA